MLQGLLEYLIGLFFFIIQGPEGPVGPHGIIGVDGVYVSTMSLY